MELNVNEYIKSNQGIIAKLVEIENEFYYFDKFVYEEFGEDVDVLGEDELEEWIEIHNLNLFKILEIGDYVNGEKITKIYNPLFLSFGEVPYVLTNENNKYELHEIKDILTKKEFDIRKYILRED